MNVQLFVRRTQSWIPVLMAALACPLLMGGCPPTGDGDGNPPDDATVTVTVQGQGTVDQEADGNSVTLTATAAEGWEFSAWEGANVANDNPLTVDATQVTALTAVFIESDEPPPAPADTDGDGVRDTVDNCPNTPEGAPVNENGCAPNQRDTDGDGVVDSLDACVNTPNNVTVDNRGCPVSAPGSPDDDDDGVGDDIDQCLNTPAGEEPDVNGCAPSERDNDGDGVHDDVDECLTTPDDAVVDATGCAATELDTDSDGINDATDQCPGTAPRTPVGANGCPTTGGGGGGGNPPPTPVCGNSSVETGEQCDDGNTTAGDGCSATCQSEPGGPRCGNGIVEIGEQCDDGNTSSGDGCNAQCQFERPANDRCVNAIAIAANGTTSYNNSLALTDGSDADLCDFGFVDGGRVMADIWYCYTATCTGEAVASLCGSDYDTKLAVYSGCTCPTGVPLDCSDDDCGAGVENVQSRVTFSATAGQSYLIRVGGYNGDTGDGQLTLRCGVDTCATGTGDCFAASPSDAPGCGDATCCRATCETDRFCCDVTWDDFCAGEATGICTGSFPECGVATAGACDAEHDTGGCSDGDCCNAVCLVDPFCCLNAWDGSCVDRAVSYCGLNCGRGAGSCTAPHTSPGCDNAECCGQVCPEDPYCCETEWDQPCVDLAVKRCQ